MITLTVGPDESGNTKFGEILQNFRMRNRLSRAEAADRIGVSGEYIRLMERGERTPALGTMLKMLDIYEVPCDLINKSQVTFSDVSVTFTSRIKEARHHFPKLTHNELIGQIVMSLVLADEKTVKKVYKILN